MRIEDLLSKYYNRQVAHLKGGGIWKDIIFVDSKNSTRYAVCFNEKNFVTFDRKTGEKKTFFKENVQNLPEVNKKSDEIDITQKIKELCKKPITSHIYFKKLDDINLNAKIYEIWYGNFLIPYTNLDMYPIALGGKYYPSKKTIGSSKMKGNFGIHKYNPNIKNYIIGEGFKECMLAAHLCPNHNVIEAGGINNVLPIVEGLPEESNIIVMGENDSVNEYKKMQVKCNKLKITFPLKGKDFADQYIITKDKKDTKECIIGNSINQSEHRYKALGLRDNYINVYSKITNNICTIHPNDKDTVLRTCFDLVGLEDLKNKEKLAISNRIFSECALAGSYNAENEYGIGLHKYGGSYYYNTGANVYKLNKDKLEHISYADALKNDFLLIKQHTQAPYIPEGEFPRNEFLKALLNCDWELKVYAKVLIGFLAQSIFAGVLEFRPHLWLESNTAGAGKSWLSNFIGSYVLPMARAQESGKTTESGLRQDIAGYHNLVLIDEFGEKGTTFSSNTVQILDLLLSASTSQKPIKLGTREQKAILQKIKFSALLSCIDGSEYLKEQHYERVIFIKLILKSKENFLHNIEPMFRRLKKLDTFLYYMLCRLNKYFEYLPYFLAITSRDFKSHRYRGVASILAGFGAYMDSRDAGEQMYKELKLSDERLFESFKTDADEDLLLRILNYPISRAKFIDKMFEGYISIFDAINGKFLNEFGIKLSEGKVYIVPKVFCNLLKQSHFSSLPAEHLSRELRKSEYYVCRDHTMRVAGKRHSLRFENYRKKLDD